MSGVRGALANAIRKVNARYYELPVRVQNSIEIGYDALDAEIDAAILGGDRERALKAIDGWAGHWLARFVEASR